MIDSKSTISAKLGTFKLLEIIYFRERSYAELEIRWASWFIAQLNYFRQAPSSDRSDMYFSKSATLVVCDKT